MLKTFIRRSIEKHRALILHEVQHLNGFMALLMKQRNSGTRWSTEEKVRLKGYIGQLLMRIPVLIVFIMPGGFFLVPVLAEILDRRRAMRVADALTPEPAAIHTGIQNHRAD